MFSPDVEALVPQDAFGAAVPEAGRVVPVLAHCYWLVDGRQDEPLYSFFVGVGQLGHGLLPLELCLDVFVADGLAVVVELLLFEEGLVIIHRRLLYHQDS